MKIENMRTAMVKLYGKDRGGFLYRCLMNTTGKANVLYRRYWEKAPTVKAFIGDVHADQSLRFDSSGRGQAYGLLAKLDHWEPSVDYKSERVRRFIISADAGSVQIGDLAGTSAMNIPNGYGNGCMRVFVISLGDGNVFNSNAFDFIATVRGRFQIYSYDCADLTESTNADLDGEYGVYAADGTVVFQQWK